MNDYFYELGILQPQRFGRRAGSVSLWACSAVTVSNPAHRSHVAKTSQVEEVTGEECGLWSKHKVTVASLNLRGLANTSRTY